jgi:glucose/arabinose dehydrogenase
MRTRAVPALVLSLFMSTPLAAEITKAPAQKTRQAIKVETFAKGLVHPWGMAFLPDGRLLVTERPGRLRIVGKDGKLSPPVAGVPKVYASGQGGLLDVQAGPDFAATGAVYLS